MIKIYLIINLINNKKYVGQTTKTIKQRWDRHIKSNTNFPIHNAIRKYGKDNFVISEIDSSDNLDKANWKEVYWGLFYNSIFPNGYNLRLGDRKTIYVSDAIKEKISKSNTGRKASEETKAKLKIARNKRTISKEAYQKAAITRQKTHPNHFSDCGKKAWIKIRASGRTQTTTDKSHWQTPEFKEKCRINVIKRSNETGRLFQCNETKQTFRNCGECARQMNLRSYKTIWKCLKRLSKSYKGFTFTYLE